MVLISSMEVMEGVVSTVMPRRDEAVVLLVRLAFKRANAKPAASASYERRVAVKLTEPAWMDRKM